MYGLKPVPFKKHSFIPSRFVARRGRLKPSTLQAIYGMAEPVPFVQSAFLLG
jgi:hypothetical protein